LDFSANIKIFPGPNRSWPTAGQVKAEKERMAFIFGLGHMRGQGSGEYIPILEMRLENKGFTILMRSNNGTTKGTIAAKVTKALALPRFWGQIMPTRVLQIQTT